MTAISTPKSQPAGITHKPREYPPFSTESGDAQEIIGDLQRGLQDCVIIDCETTGLDPVADHIIEIAALRVTKGIPIALFHRLVDPQRAIPAEISSLTGIDEGVLANAVPLESVLLDLAQFLHDSRTNNGEGEAARPLTVVGHNVMFDIGFLTAPVTASATASATESDDESSVSPVSSILELAPSDSVCTAQSARALIPRSQVGRYRLATLAQVLDLPHQPRHRSVDDVMTTLDLLRHLASLGG